MGGGDKDKDKDEGSFSGRGPIRRGDSFRGAGQEGKVVVEYVEHRTKSEVGELSSRIDIDIGIAKHPHAHPNVKQGKGGNGPKMADYRFLHQVAAHWSSHNQAK